MGYLNQPLTEFAANAQFITPALVAQLLQCCYADLKTHLQVFCETHQQATWREICHTADAFQLANAGSRRPEPKPGLTPNKAGPEDKKKVDRRPLSHLPNQCTVHPRSKHTNAECYQQKPASSRSKDIESRPRQVSFLDDEPASEELEQENEIDAVWMPVPHRRRNS
jgi:hypothetical protein